MAVEEIGRGGPIPESKESTSLLTVELPESLKKSIEALAEKEGDTVSQFLASAATGWRAFADAARKQ